MKIRQLRAILNRYGAAGVLFVGSYLAAHHAWHRRRKTCIAGAASLLALIICFLLHPASVPPVRKHLPVALPPLPAAPAPAPTRLHLSLQDDTQPGPLLPPAVSDRRVSNGFVVFDATYYHKSGHFYQDPYGDGKEETLEGNEHTSHIYRINADGSHRRQLTWGDRDDRSPGVSPDGQRVAFRRTTASHDLLCWVSIHGGYVHTLMSLPPCDYPPRPAWSPDGKWLAFVPTNWQTDQLYILSLSGRKQIRVPNIKDIAWSPDSRLYVRDTQEHARIFRPGSAGFTPVRDVVHHAVWLDNHTLAGDIGGGGSHEYAGNDALRVINDRGCEIRQEELCPAGRQNGYETLFDQHVWYRLPQHPYTLILETRRSMSDGSHSGCYRVDARTGKARLLEDGALIGIAPDGSQVAVADQAWVGPYKRGGERVGPLKIVTLESGRSHAITDPLSCISGGDWQAAPPAPPPSTAAALLQAVERGDLARTRLLLAHGASANARCPDGATALMIAAGEGNTDMVRLLLRFHASPNRADKTGATALMAAAGARKAADDVSTTRQIAIAQALMEAGALLNAQNHEGRTALMEAASNGRAVVADWLLRHGAQVDRRDNEGETALMQAASAQYAHTTQVLLDHGAAVNLRNKRKETVLAVSDNAHTTDDGSVQTHILLQQAGAIKEER